MVFKGNFGGNQLLAFAARGLLSRGNGLYLKAIGFGPVYSPGGKTKFTEKLRYNNQHRLWELRPKLAAHRRTAHAARHALLFTKNATRNAVGIFGVRLESRLAGFQARTRQRVGLHEV